MPPTSDARTVQVADVFKAGRRAAQLARVSGGTTFAYVPEYAADGVDIATTLPISADTLVYQAGAVPPFFAGMLPEGRRLTALRRLVKTSADDELSLLLAVGRDVIGDVQVVPEGETPTEAETLITVQSSFSEVRFSQILADAGVVDRTGIPGVQDKASARMISVPVARAAGRYILKVDPPEFEHVVENEHYFLTIARSAGILTTEAELVEDAEGRKGLLVRRFDRAVDAAGAAYSRACEDACQLMNLWPADKYNVNAERLTAAVADVCAAGPVAVREVYRQLCFAWLTGNGDVHAKNISVLATAEGEWRVAPAYDLPSTLPYGDLTLALPIQGSVDGLSRRRMLDFASSVGMTPKAATATLDDMLDATATVIADIQEGVIPFNDQTISTWTKRLSYRRTLLQG
ncbi:MAG: type II toxin-antitoxin system HipA family toxin [Acidimicrobiales bacterium]